MPSLASSFLSRILPTSAAAPNLRGEYVRVDGDGNGVDPVQLVGLTTSHAGGSNGDDDDESDEWTKDVVGDDDVHDGLPEPSEVELKTLKRVADELPWAAFLIAIVELCERFAYYGLTGPFQNYIANKWHDPNGLPGAIGLGQGSATALTNFFTFWGSSMPIFAAIVADQYLGRYPTIAYSMIIYMAGLFVLFITSLPTFIQAGLALPGLLIAMIVIGIGGGGIKANVSTLIAQQYTRTRPFLRTTGLGEKVMVDPALTIGRIFSVFYLCINVGSLSSILTTSLEAHVGFWAAYLLCFCMFIVGFCTLILGKDRYIHEKPGGSPVFNAFRIIAISIRSGSMEAAKPENLPTKRVPWTSAFVDELRSSLGACRVFLFFPIYWLAYGQMSNNFVSQAGQMQRHSIPNDLMVNLNPIGIIVMIPLCDKYVFPFLSRHGFRSAINKITLGFLLGALAMFWASFIQSRIYASGPCYTSPNACAAALQPDGSYAPNEVSVLWQIPVYIIIALSEIFASVPGLEFAYTRAPKEMKSFVMGLFILTNACGAVLGIAVSPLAVDPKLTALFFWLAITSAVSAGLFWLCFRELGDQDKPS